jgi:hypothetical protein
MANTTKTGAFEKTRLQVDMTRERLDAIDQLVSITGLATRKDLLDNALTLLAWVVRETRRGRAIGSADISGENFKEVAMPCLAIAHEKDSFTS